MSNRELCLWLGSLALGISATSAIMYQSLANAALALVACIYLFNVWSKV